MTEAQWTRVCRIEGASAPGEVVMAEYGFTVANVCKRASVLVKRQ